jgi:hypothetical protein
MREALAKKLDARARFQLPRGELKGVVEVLIRTSGPLGPEQQAELFRVGGKVRSMMGNIVSATVNATALEALAQLSFVRKIELSRTMFNEYRRKE